MARPLWFVEFLRKSYAKRVPIVKLTQLPLIGHIVERLLFKGDQSFFLPKDNVIQIQEDIPLPESTVLPSEVVDHFIEQASHCWIMNACLCRQSNQCKDYPIELGCLFLGEAVLGINPKLGRLVSKEEAHEHVRRCREAGLVHMIGRNKIDTVWLGIGPGDKLMTICNCCPCCCLWNTLPHMHPSISERFSRMPGVRVQVTEQCVGCGACLDEVCFVQAIHLENGLVVIDDNSCRGCGRCVEVCPQHAIEITLADPRFAEQTITHLAALVDISGGGSVYKEQAPKAGASKTGTYR
ncbi:MAG: 4Fe-4S binding protein [Chloroflexi bacterium]|nr:4Fe-4S binding protein [Chloroflexota bacterium]